MAKRHYIPVTADVPGAASADNCALIRKVIRTALQLEGVTLPCEVDVLLTNDAGIHAINPGDARCGQAHRCAELSGI